MPVSADSFLRKHKSVYIDTSVFIYFVEKNARYHKICESIFENIESGAAKASTSTLSLLEVLVKPYKLKRDDLILSFYSLFTTYPNISWIDLTLGISDLAAKLRAEHGLKTPDAIQAASAISHGTKGFICNDRIFKKVRDIDCLIIDDCV
ncbi:MAG: type II toxin-antitoxin system VapC family toxin [Thermodesulfovibrionales bacterium]|nr:type II toxin-antitoxin system VapC family toxin [Thermodesulfovibrionales bacterium]